MLLSPPGSSPEPGPLASQRGIRELLLHCKRRRRGGQRGTEGIPQLIELSVHFVCV